MSVAPHLDRSGVRLRGRILPTTRLGRIACWLALGFVAWFVGNQAFVVAQMDAQTFPRLPLILYGLSGLALGFATGVVALVAVVRQHERGALVFVAMLPLAMVLFLVIGELLFPH